MSSFADCPFRQAYQKAVDWIDGFYVEGLSDRIREKDPILKAELDKALEDIENLWIEHNQRGATPTMKPFENALGKWCRLWSRVRKEIL